MIKKVKIGSYYFPGMIDSYIENSLFVYRITDFIESTENYKCIMYKERPYCRKQSLPGNLSI